MVDGSNNFKVNRMFAISHKNIDKKSKFLPKWNICVGPFSLTIDNSSLFIGHSLIPHNAQSNKDSTSYDASVIVSIDT